MLCLRDLRRTEDPSVPRVRVPLPSGEAANTYNDAGRIAWFLAEESAALLNVSTEAFAFRILRLLNYSTPEMFWPDVEWIAFCLFYAVRKGEAADALHASERIADMRRSAAKNPRLDVGSGVGRRALASLATAPSVRGVAASGLSHKFDAADEVDPLRPLLPEDAEPALARIEACVAEDDVSGAAKACQHAMDLAARTARLQLITDTVDCEDFMRRVNALPRELVLSSLNAAVSGEHRAVSRAQWESMDPRVLPHLTSIDVETLYAVFEHPYGETDAAFGDNPLTLAWAKE